MMQVMTLQLLLTTSKKENLMKLKTLVMLSGFSVLATIIVCVSIYSHYNAWVSGSHDRNNETISFTAGANSTGLVTGSVSASASVGSAVDKDDVFFWRGIKASVTASMAGPDSKRGNASGYVSGRDVHNWHHRRTHDVTYNKITKTFSGNTTHTITPP